MSAPRIVKPQPSAPLVEAAFRDCAGTERLEGFTRPAPDAAEWGERMAGAEAVVHFFADGPVPAEAIAVARPARIAVAGPPAACLDADALRAAELAGVRVSGSSGLAAQAVAEFTLCLLLERVRLHPARPDGYGLQLAGATLGIVGFGAIGERVASLARAFGMRVLVRSASLNPERARRAGVRTVSLPRLLAESDAVSLHLRHRPGEPPLVDERFLAGLRPGAVLVNTARTALLELAAVRAAVRDGRLGGLALDARDGEIAAGDPLRDSTAVRICPHQAWMTETAVRAMAADAMEAVRYAA